MTGPTFAHPQRREEDHTWFARGRAWWTRNWSIIAGVWLAFLSAWVIWVSNEVRLSEKESNAAAKVSCERSREFAPRVADDYERRGVFPPSVIAKYRGSIPEVCPD